MSPTAVQAWALITLHVALQIFFIGRALLRPQREPAARMAWLVVILVAPVVGMAAYMLFGETNLGRGRVARLRAAMAKLPSFKEIGGHQGEDVEIEPRVAPLFRVGESISGFPPVGGNSGVLLPDSAATIDALVADIETARDHVHLLFYIWLPDTSGTRVAEACIAAARRGVTVRAMADDLGSRIMIRSDQWRRMEEAGVLLVRALSIGNPFLRSFKGRVDMRNHRKIVVIDNRLTYAGSQNCADAAFAIKARYAPWVDAMVRFEGPIVRQNQHLFAGDWMAHTSEDLSPLLAAPTEPVGPGFVAQVIGTGAAVRFSSMPEMFELLMYAARRELIVTTPYFVPDEPILAALCAAPRRGAATTLVVPKRNDSWIVAAASRSYYPQLLDAGVRIYEYRPGLLHTKSLTVDDDVTLIGSANIDRRSFELNFENNILLQDADLTREIRARQLSYIAEFDLVERSQVEAWSLGTRLAGNAIAMFRPVL